MVPYNLLQKKQRTWKPEPGPQKAIKEAKLFGPVEIVASSGDKNFTYIPERFHDPQDADYSHITTNNTIFGSEIQV